MSIRVLHVIDHLGYGGAPIVVKNIAERLTHERIETFVCSLRTNPLAMPIETKLINLTHCKYNPYTVLAIANLCRQYKINIVHAHLQKSIISSLLASFFCNSKIIIHEHGPIFCGGVGCFYRLLLKLLSQRAVIAIANSQATKIALHQIGTFAEQSIPIVSNFIDFARFDNTLYDRQLARGSLGIAKDKIVIGFVGRLDYYKGPDLLVDAAAILSKTNEQYCFVIVGEGSERKRLEKQTLRLGIKEKIIFTGVRKNPAEVISAFDIAVIPSRCEAFGISALEFMRMKIPIVASPAGGLVELVQHEQTGILLESLTAENIADAVNRLVHDSPLRGRLTKAAEVFSRKFDGEEQLKRITDIYEKLSSREGSEAGGQGPAEPRTPIPDPDRYERLHGEIFNPIEQERLRSALSAAIKAIRTNSSALGGLTALDYGCGSGNLSRHLIDLGINTVSADISESFLSLIERDFSQTGLSKVLKVNGKDLSNVPDAQFDFVAAYSVLHHVPDYLHAVSEMCRVLKPGGVIYIDHEVNESYYKRPKEYVEFLKYARPIINLKRYLNLLLNVKNYIYIFRRLMNPRYKREGDIHVWPDDHIEWDKIEQILISQGFEMILKQDYLLYKNIYDVAIYNEYKNKCSDERVLAARKQ